MIISYVVDVIVLFRTRAVAKLWGLADRRFVTVSIRTSDDGIGVGVTVCIYYYYYRLRRLYTYLTLTNNLFDHRSSSIARHYFSKRCRAKSILSLFEEHVFSIIGA